MIRFTEHSENIMKQFGFYSYYFISHEIAIPIIRAYEITKENYFSYVLRNEANLVNQIVPLKYITDLDFIFSFALNFKV